MDNKQKIERLTEYLNNNINNLTEDFVFSEAGESYSTQTKYGVEYDENPYKEDGNNSKDFLIEMFKGLGYEETDYGLDIFEELQKELKDHKGVGIEEIFMDNTYNWSWNFPADVVVKIVNATANNGAMELGLYICVYIHAGGDIRGNYYPALVLKEERTQDDEWYTQGILELLTFAYLITLEFKDGSYYGYEEQNSDTYITRQDIEDILSHNEENKDCMAYKFALMLEELEDDEANDFLQELLY